MKYPKYIKTRDGYIGTLEECFAGEHPVYKFPGGYRIADDYEIEHGSDNVAELYVDCTFTSAL